jgi:alpha-D-xyloside xylohydrolase
LICLLGFSSESFAQLPLSSGAQNHRLLNDALDISEDFYNFANTYFVADSLVSFNPETGMGKVKWMRYQFRTRHAFNNTLAALSPVGEMNFRGWSMRHIPNWILPLNLFLQKQSGYA